MRLLTVTTLYPNAVTPTHAVFVENRLRRILELGGIKARVIAPVPWFPFTNARFGQYAKYAAVPSPEDRFGIPITHPRFVTIPKMPTLQPWSYFRMLKAEVRRLEQQGEKFDLIDAQYIYPDAVAAAKLGKILGIPVVATARGSDLHQIAHLPAERRQIQAALPDIARIVTVSAALGLEAQALGYPAGQIAVLRNGVDTAVFHPVDGKRWRLMTGNASLVFCSVGLLIERKGHEYAIRALAEFEDAHLLIAGTGPLRDSLESLAATLGLSARVHFLGALPHEDLASLYSAADVMILATSREGWPNVVLESMGCGTPVVATNIGGIPEIITNPMLGEIVDSRSGPGIAAGIRALLSRQPDRNFVKAHAEAHSWDDTVARQAQLYHDVVDAWKKS
jgi:teichuronic acid biosynthesis glycosyltransferase TuaC